MNPKYQLPQDIAIPTPREYHYDQTLNTEAFRAAAVFDDALESSITPPGIFFQLFVRKEMETTSKIEGTRVAFQDMVLSEDKEDDETSPDVLEAFGVRRAIEAGELSLNRGIPISNRFIKTMHKALMVWARNSHGKPGELRRVPVAVGRRYFPPEPQHIANLMSDLEKYIHRDLDTSPIVKIAIIHAQFEIIHPFADGNGRIGRLLIPFLMKEYKVTHVASFFISQYFEKNRSEYYSTLEGITKNKNWGDWIAFFLHSVATHGREMKQKTDRLSQLYQDADFLKMRTASSQHLKNYIFEKPIFTVSGIVRNFERDEQKVSGRNYLHKVLQSTGDIQVLSPGKGRRKTVYRCPDIIDVLH